MVYASGKYVCLGGKSTVDMVTIARKVARKVQRIGNQPGAEEYKEVRRRRQAPSGDTAADSAGRHSLVFGSLSPPRALPIRRLAFTTSA